MIIEIDSGNTRLKWRALRDEYVVARGYSLEELWSRIELLTAVSQVRVASVRAAADTNVLVRLLAERTGSRPMLARSTQRCGSVVNGYAEPEVLGVDRWLAVVAAYHAYRKAILVVDCGSALTMDVVDGQGLHRGGYILPGRGLMEDRLLSRTGRVRFGIDDRSQSIAPGTTTGACVSSGIGAALVGAVLVGYRSAAADLGTAPLVVVTGGDAAELCAMLRALDGPVAERVPELVMDGLRWAVLDPGVGS